MVSVKIPIEPVAASRPRFGNGFTYTAKTYRQYKDSLALLFRNQYRGAMLAGALEVCVVFTLTKPKTVTREFPSVKPDIDNFVKAAFDAANGIFWQDDSQIVDIHAFKVYGEPSVLISIKQKGAI